MTKMGELTHRDQMKGQEWRKRGWEEVKRRKRIIWGEKSQTIKGNGRTGRQRQKRDEQTTTEENRGEGYTQEERETRRAGHAADHRACRRMMGCHRQTCENLRMLTEFLGLPLI